MSLQLRPSYTGFIGSTKDAILIIQAVLSGDLPVVEQRPQDRERVDLIKSGNVFVFIEESSGIKRWTDGVSWSASRVLGRFLVYRELDPSSVSEKEDKKKRRKHLDFGPSLRRPLAQEPFQPPPDSSMHQPEHHKLAQIDAYRNQIDQRTANPPFNSRQEPLPGYSQGISPRLHNYGPPHMVPREQQPQEGIEDHGLIKKTISITTGVEDEATDSKKEKQTIHLISYYCAHDVLSGKLTRPSHGSLKNLTVPPLLWEAVKRSSLGGKIPIEDEAYYFLDLSYQLQNMSVLFNNKPEAKQSPKGTSVSHQGQAVGNKSLAQSTAVSNKLPYVLVAPFSGPAPPITFNADYSPQQFQQVSAKKTSLASEPVKKEEGQAQFGGGPTYAAQNLPLQGYNPTAYAYNYHNQSDQRSLEFPMQPQYGMTSQISPNPQHLPYDMQPHHHPHQAYSSSAPPGSHEFHYSNQEGTFLQGYPGQYAAVPYQMYNNPAYFNPGGGQIVPPANLNLSSGAGLVPQQPSQVQQPSHSDSRQQPNQQQQHLQQLNDYSQRTGVYYEGSGGQLAPRGGFQNPLAFKRPMDYPEYHHPVEEPHNYN